MKPAVDCECLSNTSWLSDSHLQHHQQRFLPSPSVRRTEQSCRVEGCLGPPLIVSFLPPILDAICASAWRSDVVDCRSWSSPSYGCCSHTWDVKSLPRAAWGSRPPRTTSALTKLPIQAMTHSSYGRRRSARKTRSNPCALSRGRGRCICPRSRRLSAT